MGTINTFLFTTGDGTRSQPLPVTLDAVLAMPSIDKVAERDMLTSFVIFHTLFIAIEVARDTETGIVQEPWTDKDVEAQLLWCADRGWDFVQECIQEELCYGGAK